MHAFVIYFLHNLKRIKNINKVGNKENKSKNFWSEDSKDYRFLNSKTPININ